MSLDLWLASPECPTCTHSERTESVNCTYNLNKMWYEIYPEDENMIQIDGMTGNESFLKLNYALSALLGEPDKFKALNPANGWGSYDGLIEYIVNLLKMSKEHPDWVWESCR